MSAAAKIRSDVAKFLDDYVDVKSGAVAAHAVIDSPIGGAVKALLKKSPGGKGRVTGMKPIRLRMPFSFSFNCAAGGAITPAGLAVTPDSNTTEWAAIAALYDEYKVHGGEVAWANTYQTPAGANTVDAMGCVIAYDPVDSAALTGVRNGTELAQHQLKFAQATAPAATTSAAISMSFGRANGEPYRFKFAPQAAFAGASTTSVQAAPGQWKQIAVAGSNGNDGWLKYYGTSDNANAVLCVTGIVYVDVSFRARK